MMLRIARHEFSYMLKSPQTIVSFAIFFLLAFFSIAFSDNVQIGGGGGNVDVNSPFAITQTLLILSVFAIFVIPSFVANSILKDVDHKFDGILFSTPISKADYLLGRFFGSFSAMAAALAGAPLGMLIGAFWPSLDPETIAPTNLNHYFTVYLGFVLPSVLALSAMIYAVAVVSRSVMYTYLVAMGLLILYLIGNEILDTPANQEMSALLDPFMLETFFEKTRYWTAADRNSTLISYEGVVLLNRIIWFGVAASFTALSYFLFSFRAPAKMAREKKGAGVDKAEKQIAQINVGTRGTPIWGRATEYAQLWLRTKFEVLSVLKSLPFLIIMGFSLFMLISALVFQEFAYGVSPYPVTRIMIQVIQGTMGLALIIVLIFYSADIIWRERKDKFNEIMDALPTPNWVYVASKLAALTFVLFAILLMGIFVSVMTQIFSGYSSFEAALYLERGLFYFVMPFVMVAVLGCFVQVLSKNRFMGMMIMVLFLISRIVLANLGFEHPLYQYGFGGIATPLSDMNGSGRFIEGGYWVRAYWSAFAVLLLMLTYLLWNRGTLQPLKYRLRNLKAVKTYRFAIPAIVAFGVVVGTGSYVFYNVNIVNDYVTAEGIEDQQVAYETRYRQYENLPMPRTVDVKIDVDIYPYKRRVEARSTQILENKTDENISTVHLVFALGTEVPLLELEGAQQPSFDADFNYYIFDLEKPMVPGEKRTLRFKTLIQQQGFDHRRPSLTLVRNGTFINNQELAPYIGFFPGAMLADRNERRKREMEPLPRTAKLEDKSQYGNNYIRQDSDFVTFETTVSTIASQRVVSPGYLQKEWTEGDRRYFSYKMDAPIMNFYSYLSAEYEVVRDEFEGVDIEVFHHAPHPYNVERMIAAVKDSLAYYGKAFSPYQYKQVRILEFPAYRNFAQAFPNTIPYSEGIGFVAKITENSEVDLPYYVTAHEMAHQWWAHQVMSANVQGGTMLVETLSQYGALLIMEQKYGKDQIRKFLKFELDNYLSARAGDAEGELPLYRVENQQYIHYNKGSVIMYALKDYLGEDVVNRSLRRLIALRQYESAPYAISTDLITILKEEAGPENVGLIEDFFEKITIFDVKMKESRVEEMADGRFKVLLDVEVAKVYADKEGQETKADFDIPVDIGLFLKNPGADGFDSTDVLMLEKRRITEASTTLEIFVKSKPAFAGIDPYNKLIDRNSDDNLKAVEEADRQVAANE